MGLAVTVDINANMMKLAGQVDKAVAKFEDLEHKAKSTGEKLQMVGEKIKGALELAGIGLGANELKEYALKGLEAAASLEKMHLKTGIAVEDIQGLKLAVKMGGTDMDSFALASNKLSVYMAKNEEAMKAIGVTSKDPLKAFEQFSEVFKKIEDPQRRAALGAAVLGRSWAEMAPILMKGATGIQELVDKGHSLYGVTKEQAEAAEELQKKYEALTNKGEARNMKTSIFLMEPLIALGEEIDKEIEKSGVLMGLLKGIANGWDNFRAPSIEGVSNELTEINRQIAEQKLKIKDSKNGGNDSAAFASSSERTLSDLEKKRQEMIEEISEKRNANIIPEHKINAAAVNNVIGIGDDSEKSGKKAADASKKAADAEKRRAEAIQKTIEALKWEISLSGIDADQAKLIDDIHKSTINATDKEAAAIEKLIRTKYDLADIDAMASDGDKLAKKQLEEMAADYERLSEKFHPGLKDLNANINDAMNARAHGIIPNDEELKKQLDKIGTDYNGMAEKSKEATDSLSAYSEQAAKNMETSFADFLFNPWNKGLQGMVNGFVISMEHMVANAASAKIMESLFGNAASGAGGAAGASSGLIGGLFGSLFSGIGGSGASVANGNSAGFVDSMANLFAPVKHSGGLIGGGGITREIPQHMFIGAQRYHSGGIVGLQTGEVPAILQTGEQVLSRAQVAAGAGSGNNTTVNINGTQAPTPQNAAALSGQIAAAVRQVMIAEQRPGGLLAPS